MFCWCHVLWIMMCTSVWTLRRVQCTSGRQLSEGVKWRVAGKANVELLICLMINIVWCDSEYTAHRWVTTDSSSRQAITIVTCLRLEPEGTCATGSKLISLFWWLRKGGEAQAAGKKRCGGGGGRKSKAKAAPTKDPQSVAAKVRRELISERLKVLQDLVPNGTKQLV